MNGDERTDHSTRRLRGRGLGRRRVSLLDAGWITIISSVQQISGVSNKHRGSVERVLRGTPPTSTSHHTEARGPRAPAAAQRALRARQALALILSLDSAPRSPAEPRDGPRADRCRKIRQHLGVSPRACDAESSAHRPLSAALSAHLQHFQRTFTETFSSLDIPTWSLCRPSTLQGLAQKVYIGSHWRAEIHVTHASAAGLRPRVRCTIRHRRVLYRTKSQHS